MNDDIIADLKQFIATNVSQQTDDLRQEFSGLREKVTQIDTRQIVLDQKVTQIDDKMDNLTSLVAEAIDVSNETNGSQLDDHERRIAKLEHSTAAA